MKEGWPTGFEVFDTAFITWPPLNLVQFEHWFLCWNISLVVLVTVNAEKIVSVWPRSQWHSDDFRAPANNLFGPLAKGLRRLLLPGRPWRAPRGRGACGALARSASTGGPTMTSHFPMSFGSSYGFGYDRKSELFLFRLQPKLLNLVSVNL